MASKALRVLMDDELMMLLLSDPFSGSPTLWGLRRSTKVLAKLLPECLGEGLGEEFASSAMAPAL